ncbi:MAG: hypothetical protein ACTSWY_08620 [Promethearchaeota archaeon]
MNSEICEKIINNIIDSKIEGGEVGDGEIEGEKEGIEKQFKVWSKLTIPKFEIPTGKVSDLFGVLNFL